MFFDKSISIDAEEIDEDVLIISTVFKTASSEISQIFFVGTILIDSCYTIQFKNQVYAK